MAQRRKSGFQFSYVTITYLSVFRITGTVDLATSNIASGSKPQVSVAGSVTNFAPDSAAQVINDTRNEQSSIFGTKGSREASRGEERVSIGVNEKLSIPTDTDSKMVKTRELGAPVLISPTLPQISLSPGERGVTFSWSPVDNVRGYHVGRGRNQFFRPVYFERQVNRETDRHDYYPECERGLQPRIAADHDPVESLIVPAAVLFQTFCFPHIGGRVGVAVAFWAETTCGWRCVRPGTQIR